MARPRITPDHILTPAERARRYRQRHRVRINRTLRKRRKAATMALPVLHEGRERIRLTQLDGALPNLALMRLAAFHKAQGDEVVLSRTPYRSPTEGEYQRVYGSAIFSFTAQRVARFRAEFPGAIVGGTWNQAERITVEDVVGDFNGIDYSPWPDFTASLGFTQRGCRLKCGFCVVPRKEGKPRTVATVPQIWRGKPWPRHLHLLDNDFFGQPAEQWQARIAEIRADGFKVSFTQGINVRAITPEAATALASVHYTDDQFKRRRLYTAWDNLGDERAFFRGVDVLANAGIPPSHLLAYMLVGYDRRETWERVLYRFHRMADLGIRPFPMIYGERRRGLPAGDIEGGLTGRTLAHFQRWAVRRLYTVVPFAEYDGNARWSHAEHNASKLTDAEPSVEPVSY
jgi:hypothetical protein